MIWAIVSSQSCFCWLSRASPSSAAKNIINLISVLTIWWWPCIESSLVLLEESVCYDQCGLLTKLCSPLPCFILYSKAKLACYSRFKLPTFVFQSPVMKESEVAQSCLTLCDPIDGSPPCPTIPGILQARTLEWVAISFSKGSSQPRDRTWVSHFLGRRFSIWATRESLCDEKVWATRESLCDEKDIYFWC